MEEESRRRRKRSVRSFWGGVLVGMMSMVLLGALVIGISGALALFRYHSIIPVTGNMGGQNPSVNQSGSLGSNEAAFNRQLEQKLSEINEIVDNTFIFEVKPEDMMNRALAGYMAGLNDVYSVYYTPEQYAETMEDGDGRFVGIGVSVQQSAETLEITVLNVYEGSPAEAGGMLDGDIIVGVDDVNITGMELNDVVKMIRGEVGTEVVVTVYRNHEYLDLTMIRNNIQKHTVEHEMLEDQVGYIKLTEFDDVSVEQMKDAILDLQSQGMKSLVLDLRNNPGGLLTSVVSIADFFLPKCNVFYYEDKQEHETRYDSSDDQICTEPMTVLINGYSASASEVLSGALKDQNRAVVVGEQSFGKGIVQSFYGLSDGSAIKLTTAHYFTPNGTDIHGVGIAPNMEVEDDPETEDVDEQLQAAIDELKK